MSLHRTAYLVALVEGDRAASARHLEWGLKAPDPVAGARLGAAHRRR